MKKTEFYKGIYPAFYACYDADGNISRGRTIAYAAWLVKTGVQGLYVGGSSGECVYLGVEERKKMLEYAMEGADGKINIIAHVACNNTADSMRLASHAQSLGVQGIAAIPPIYFKLPDYAIASYWNDISSAAPKTDFFLYNIPQLAGVALSLPLLKDMLKNPRVVGLKNSSPLVQDIFSFRQAGGEDFVVFNGADEQHFAGRMMGATGGIGGTYGAMPELFLRLEALLDEGAMARAQALQAAITSIIYASFACRAVGSAVFKAIAAQRTGLELGGVRAPMPQLATEDMPIIKRCVGLIEGAIKEFG